MKKQKDAVERGGPLFRVEERGELDILRIRPREEIEGPTERDIASLFSFLEGLRTRRRKVLAIIAPPNLFDVSSMERFWDRVASISPGWGFAADSGGESELIRGENAFFRFITTVRAADTFILCGLQGEVMLPFLGLALACDYRVVSCDTVFINRCRQWGMPPCGALAWFFLRHVGRGKMVELLLERDEIPVAEARELGLVDRLAKPEALEEQTAAAAENFASRPTGSLVGAKRMLNAAHLDLGSYLDRESKAFFWCLSEMRRKARDTSV